MKNQNTDKEMADLYFKLFASCLKFKTEKKDKEIDCSKFYNNFELHAVRYVDSKQENNKA